MRIFHLADLHIGKSVNGFSLLSDQSYILRQILDLVEAYQPEVVILAGDIYDKAVPSGMAVTVFDNFLTELALLETTVLAISGNHDSPERLEFGSRIMESKKIHLAGSFSGEIKQVRLEDSYGTVVFHLLPFLRPAQVRAAFPEESVESYEEAVRILLEHNPVDVDLRNVLIAHQFVLPLEGEILRSDSETEAVGSLSSIPSTLFSSYDYVALGHLHRPQRVGRETVRYAGSPLKYSFSETHHRKSVTMLELGSKGEYHIEDLILNPLRDMRKISGPFEALTSKTVLEAGNTEDYLHITLTDEDEIIDAIGKLRRVYPQVMELAFDNSRTRSQKESLSIDTSVLRSPEELFQDFFQQQNGVTLTQEQLSLVRDFLKREDTSS